MAPAGMVPSVAKARGSLVPLPAQPGARGGMGKERPAWPLASGTYRTSSRRAPAFLLCIYA